MHYPVPAVSRRYYPIIVLLHPLNLVCLWIIHCGRGNWSSSAETKEGMDDTYEEIFNTNEEQVVIASAPQQRIEITTDSSVNWIPECDEHLTPKEGMIFDSVKSGIQFYKDYGRATGFDVRISTTKRFHSDIIRTQYVVCNREGFKKVGNSSASHEEAELNDDEVSQVRHRKPTRVGCKARCVFQATESGSYTVKSFEIRHTHSLTPGVYRHFLKANRKLNLAHQKFILSCIKANIGPAKTYRLYKEMVGGYSNVGALPIDFKNFKRELKAYVCGADAQLIVDKFLKKIEVCPNTAFNYDVDENDQLTRLFWADPMCKQNYRMFGDVISFDATYNTNRYKMVFAPFTGVDNHRRCVTFASGLLLKEDEESYVWLFENFLKAMGHEPTYIVTDQDPAMKNAIKRVFKNSIHRLCMWHIMEKVGAKVGHTLLKDEEFMERLNRIVWSNYIEPPEFEERWAQLMNDYQLTSHSWFKHMFEIRKSWIPAYFKNVQLSGLLRTTSRSESANSWFGSFTNPQVSLVEFFMHYDSAIEAQRHAVDKLNNEMESSLPKCKTQLEIEKHASVVYTRTVFSAVSAEIESSCYKCVTMEIKNGADTCTYKIKDVEIGVFTVVSYINEDAMECSCKMFQRIGLVCRHIFSLLKEADKIPAKYIHKRWTKNASMLRCPNNDSLNNFGSDMQCDTTIQQIWSDIHYCLILSNDDKSKIEYLSSIIKKHKDQLLKDQQTDSRAVNRQTLIEGFVGDKTQLGVVVLPPTQAKNKGSGSRVKSRLQSQKEKAIKAGQKMKRRCGKCGETGSHNSRTCDK